MTIAAIAGIEQFAAAVLAGRHVRRHAHEGLGSGLAARDHEALMRGRRRALAVHTIDCGQGRRRRRQTLNERRQRTGFSFDIDKEMRPAILNEAAQVERRRERVDKRAKPDAWTKPVTSIRARSIMGRAAPMSGLYGRWTARATALRSTEVAVQPMARR